MFNEIALFLTNKCNSNCLTCNFWKNTDINHMPFETVKKTLEVYSKQNPLFIFGGGEPFLWEHIEMLEHILKINFSDIDYILLTNLKCIDRAIYSNFKRFTVSWDGFTSDSTRYSDCSNNLFRFLDNKKGKSIRIAYVLSRYNLINFLDSGWRDLYKIIRAYNLQYPYILIETDLTYFYRDAAVDKYGFGWLFDIFKQDEMQHKLLIDRLKRLNVAPYTIKAIEQIETLKEIPCANPVNTLNISWDNQIRFCPGIRWDEKLLDADSYFNSVENEEWLLLKLKDCYQCKDIALCGVGCRYHVDARNYFGRYL